MKSVLLIALLIVGSAIGQQFKRGRLVGRRKSGRVLRPPAELCTTTEIFNQKYCDGADALGCDSSGLVQCRGIGKGITWDCGGEVPYCIEDSPGEALCSTTRPSGCLSTESEAFECLEEGFFPDPSDCKTYYQCYDDGTGYLESNEWKCENFYVFDPSASNNNYCRFTWNRFCVQVNCKGTVQNILMNYPSLPKRNGEIVATCRINKKPLVTHCKAGFHANLKSLPVECIFTCTKPSKFEYPGDDTKYYDCVFTGRIFEGKVKSCYRNYYFNKIKHECEYRLTPVTTTTSTSIQPNTSETPSETSAPNSPPNPDDPESPSDPNNPISP